MNPMRIALVLALPSLALAQIDNGGFHRAEAQYDNGGWQSTTTEKGDGEKGEPEQDAREGTIERTPPPPACPEQTRIDIGRTIDLNEDPYPELDICLDEWARFDCRSERDAIAAEAEQRCAAHCAAGEVECSGRIEDFVPRLLCIDHGVDEAWWYPTCAAQVTCTCER